jgi:hypothetical protein
MSEVRRTKFETVSITTLEKFLPQSCFNAIKDLNNVESNFHHDKEIMRVYFESENDINFTEEEKMELSETLGNSLVKQNYSLDTLKSFVSDTNVTKRKRD